jgi:hypothetical protein
MLPRPGFQVELVAAEPLVTDPVDVAKAGYFDAWLEWSVEDYSAGGAADFFAGATRWIGVADQTGSWETLAQTKIGRMELKAGSQRAVFQPDDRFEGMLLDLREIRLVPVRQDG